MSPFDSIGMDEIAEARENLVVKNQDLGKTAVTDVAAPPTEVPGCLMNESHPRSRRKKRHIWRRVKQMIIRRSITL